MAAKCNEFGITRTVRSISKETIVLREAFDLLHPNCPLASLGNGIERAHMYYERTIKLPRVQFEEIFGFIPLREGPCAGL